MKGVTRYFGFVAVAIEWLGFLLCMFMHSPDWSEPASQFGYYSSTRIVFGLTFTLAAIACYLFARHLDRYWKPTSLIMLLAGISLAVTGWIPYEPYVRTFVFDTHNVAVVLAVLLYSLPMLFIGYTKAHAQIARVSYILFFTTALLVGWSIVARVTDIGIIYAQIAALLPAQAWLIIVNILLLQHHQELAAAHSTKL